MFSKKFIYLALLLSVTALHSKNDKLASLPAFDWKQYKEDNKKRLSSGISAITHDISGGMFGDNLIAYLHAKWISYKYNIPLLYVPFKHSSELVLSDAELLLPCKSSANIITSSEADMFQAQKNVALLKRDPKTCYLIRSDLCIETGIIEPLKKILYVVPWFAESLQDHEKIEDGRPYFFVNWDDENFLTQIRALISPKAKLKLLDIPKDKITVAVHVRRNRNGEDLSLSFMQDAGVNQGKQYLDDFFPFKCIDDSFYISGIRKIHELYPGQPLYVYIFTDDKNPEKIATKYQKLLNIPNIEFDYIGRSHDYSSHFLEDFFSMLKFDCLVRSDSSFSLVASKLGDYEIVISPAGYKLKNNHPVITRAYVSVKVESAETVGAYTDL